MLKTVFIWLSLAVFTLCYGKNNPENYKLVYPKYIPVYSNFDVSLITSDIFPGADRLELYVLPDGNISLQKIELKSIYESTGLSFSAALLRGYDGDAYKTVINFSDTTLTSGIFFQILMNFKSESASRSSLNFYGVFKKGSKIVGSLAAGNGDMQSNFIPVNLNFYRPQKNAGRALLIGRDSFIRFNMNNIPVHNLLTEFWIKFSGVQNSFLQITSKDNPDFNYSLSLNPFQMLLVKAGSGPLKFIDPYFAGKKSWYHISADISFSDHLIYFYCNGKLIAQSQIPFFLKPENIEYEFSNQSQEQSFQVDLLRFIDFNNSIDVSFANRNYVNFISDSSTVISQFNFDITDSYPSSDMISISSSGTQLVKSDAPIFARAPELNVVPFGSSYQLEWSGGDYKQANYYVLQKSANNSDFADLINIPADNSTDKSYSFIDKNDGTSDVIYYRIKQVNLNGSVTYSSQVKIGLGQVPSFIVEQNYPNPFNPKTSIVVNLQEDSQLEVTVYNLEGKEITRLFKGYLSQGTYTFSFDATDLPSGVYLYKVSTPKYSEMKKMILTK